MTQPYEFLNRLLRGKHGEAQRKLEYLAAVDIFRDLQPVEIEEINRATAMVTCQAGKLFYSPNESGEVLFILKKGRVQIYRMSSEGRKLALGTLEAGTVFGEMGLLGQGMYDAYAEAIEDSLLCVMNRRDVEKLLLGKPKVAIRLLDLLSRRLRDVEERFEETAFHNVRNRLAALLLRLRAEQGSDVIETTHEELGQHLGVYRETVSTALAEMKRSGIIQLSRKRIHLKNLIELERRTIP